MENSSLTGTTRRVQPSVPSASSSVCNHMVALVFGRTCTGDARRYVKRTPDFICLSGERKSHSACLQGGIWCAEHEGRQPAEALMARFADATPPWPVCLQTCREMKTCPGLFRHCLLSWGHASTLG